MDDPYDILNLPRDADLQAIKQAYRRLAKRFHPDVNAGDYQAECRFRQIQWAYEAISKPGQPHDGNTSGEALRYASDFDPSLSFFEAVAALMKKNW